MAELNQNFGRLKESYLFSDIAGRVDAFTKKHPEKSVIRMGIGDVTLPLCPSVVNAMKAACDEMGEKESFRGYGPEQGYGFLREAIADYYAQRGVRLDASEIFVSDGAKSDVGNITDLFGNGNTVLIPDPVYPVYVDSNLMLGRKIEYLDANEENGFLPLPDDRNADIIYLCSPNNPTGAVYTRDQLAAWVEYANRRGAVILFDAAYEAFVQDSSLPRSIYEIEGAKTCAVEFCSFSKTAGFTGTRCGYTVVPDQLLGGKLRKMWLRRQTTKFNGVPYIVQRGAQAVFSPAGQQEIRQAIDSYRKNAAVIAQAIRRKKYSYTGGENSPYIWMKCPQKMTSWEFFDYLLNQAAVVGTPGSGFGKNGEGWFRLTAFGDSARTVEAMRRLENLPI